MKILQTIPGILEEASGPSYSVPAMCRGLAQNGCDVSLHLLAPLAKREFPVPVTVYPRHDFPFRKLRRSPEMLKALKAECKTADIIHNHSFWMMPNIYPAWASRGTKCKLVNQPRGTLSAWALENSKWRKRLIGWYGQYSAMRATDMWAATSEEEYADIRRLGYRQPVVVLPNGIDLPQMEVCGKTPRRRMFFLSRIHPKKNLEMLIQCWAQLEGRFPDWDLSIVGPDEDNPYADEIKELAMRLGCRRVAFEGELNGEAKYRFMAESECEVLPTHSENFGMVVAESLACGTPVICSRGAPWAGLADNKCGWWVPTEDAAFGMAMAEAMSKPREELAQMGGNGKDWMRRDFNWTSIGAKMKMAYEWLLGRGDKPDWVVVD